MCGDEKQFQPGDNITFEKGDQIEHCYIKQDKTFFVYLTTGTWDVYYNAQKIGSYEASKDVVNENLAQANNETPTELKVEKPIIVKKAEDINNISIGNLKK